MYHCTECGYKSIKWLGKCPLCSGWETFNEEKEVHDDGKSALPAKEKSKPVRLRDIKNIEHQKVLSGINELDRLLGGGFVTGEAILLGGEPGVGKSTLLLEACRRLAARSKVLYVSAEESPGQVHLRAQRLGPVPEGLYILGEDNVEEVHEYIQNQKFTFVVIDSIQVVYHPRYEGLKGSVSQIRGCADYLTQTAKTLGAVIVVVGHVTKDGAIAGPKLLEHIVDCVLYFEGEHLSNYRILRASKNRFGPTGDIAVFEMASDGLKEITVMAELFLPHRNTAISGSCVASVMTGTRPITVELQALTSRASFGVVRRRSIGFDFNRFSLLIAIIEKRLKISLAGEDVFLNVAGGLRLNDPAADLAAVIAILSSFREKDIMLDHVFIGEVGLAGELRKISNINLRLKEISRTNFKKCFIPEANTGDVDASSTVQTIACGSLEEVVAKLF